MLAIMVSLSTLHPGSLEQKEAGTYRSVMVAVRAVEHLISFDPTVACRYPNLSIRIGLPCPDHIAF